MTSNRAKLVLDEQSFQGLLAAAYTIQQHNERMNAASSSKKDAETSGRYWPTEVEAANSDYRDGERLQRKWASLWQMSKDRGIEPIRGADDGLPLSPADPAVLRKAGNSPVPSNGGSRLPQQGEATAPVEMRSDVAPKTIAQQDPENSPELNSENWHSVKLPLSGSGEVDADRNHESEEYENEVEKEHAVSASDSLELIHPTDHSLSLASGNSIDSATAAEYQDPDQSEEAPATHNGLRVKIRIRRADWYLALAIGIAATALLWPTGGGDQSGLSSWDRMLIAIGIAEAPQQTVRFHGDPNLKVWVDTHTALYYCPGDELYGKSPDGHYTTQQEAQMDRFEPAERSVCIE